MEPTSIRSRLIRVLAMILAMTIFLGMGAMAFAESEPPPDEIIFDEQPLEIICDDCGADTDDCECSTDAGDVSLDDCGSCGECPLCVNGDDTEDESESRMTTTSAFNITDMARKFNAAAIEFAQDNYGGKYLQGALVPITIGYADQITVKALSDSITAGAVTDAEKTRRVFDWVTANIRYNDIAADSDLCFNGMQRPIDVIERSFAVCEGFTNLTIDLLRFAGVPCVYVGGVSNIQRFTSPQDVFNAWVGHAWLLVFLDGRWQMIDPTERVYLMPIETYSNYMIATDVECVYLFVDEMPFFHRNWLFYKDGTIRYYHTDGSQSNMGGNASFYRNGMKMGVL